MLDKIIAAAAAVVMAFAANHISAPEVRPNCYPAEIRIITTVTADEDSDFAYLALYEILETGHVYAMDAQDFLPGDHCIALMCDNDTPDDPTDDWYCRVIRWLD